MNTKRMADIGAVILVAYVVLSTVIRATDKPFWLDEIITVTLVRLPTLRGIWAALENSADSQPPTFYLFERLAAHLPVNELISFRIPSILAFSCLVVCIFLFVRSLHGSVVAFICAAIPLLSVLFYPYAVEARGYGLMAGFSALALVSYQRAHKPAWCLLLGLSLVAATASHYYAVFAAFPFALAELALLVKKRCLRVGVWIAVLLSVLPVLLFWHLLQVYKNTYGSHFIGHLSPLTVLNSYAFLWRVPPSFAVGITAGAVAAILLYAVLVGKESFATNPNFIPLQGLLLALGFVILPLVMGITFKVLHGGFLPRYMLLAVLGFPLAASYMFAVLDRRLLLLCAILVFASLGAQELWVWRKVLPSLIHKVPPTADVSHFLKSAGYDNLPVVVTGTNDYLQLAYYASPEANSRLVFIADPASALTYTGTDIADKCLLSLRPYLAIHVHDCADFFALHPDFLLYSGGSDVGDWWPARLLHERYTLTLVATDDGKRVFLVHRNER